MSHGQERVFPPASVDQLALLVAEHGTDDYEFIGQQLQKKDKSWVFTNTQIRSKVQKISEEIAKAKKLLKLMKKAGMQGSTKEPPKKKARKEKKEASDGRTHPSSSSSRSRVPDSFLAFCPPSLSTPIAFRLSRRVRRIILLCL